MRIIYDLNQKVPIYLWTDNLEKLTELQAVNLSKLPFVFHHVGLMPDTHPGKGVPIGSVVALKDAVCPNMVGVDIGCNMIAIQTDLLNGCMDMSKIRSLINDFKKVIPAGEGKFHKKKKEWDGFDIFEIHNQPVEKMGWFTETIWETAKKSLGTLGGGNHFLELQEGDDGYIWLMIHSGSRGIGYKIAEYHNKIAQRLCEGYYSDIPSIDLAFLPTAFHEGKEYIKDMNFATSYAIENCRQMMLQAKQCLQKIFPDIKFPKEINARHNFVRLENHFGKNVWVHRKGATSARDGEFGIIPGSMGTSSYIVMGKGNRDSFMSCSHGAGRPKSRTDSSRILTKEECDKAMEGIVFDRWNKIRRGRLKGKLDLSESPGAYKNIDTVISEQLDLIDVVVKLRPIGVLKG